jgi:predicted Zn-dependent peptidase
MTFSDAGQVIAKTYSPAADLDNYHASFKDSFVYDIDFVKEYLAAVNSVTAADVQALAQQILKDGNLVKVVMRPEK